MKIQAPKATDHLPPTVLARRRGGTLVENHPPQPRGSVKRCRSVAGRWIRYSTAILAVIVAAPLFACQIPVFRYALERWSADRYEIIVLHDGPLQAAQQKQLTQLRDSNFESPLAGNFDVKTVSAADIKNPRLQRAWDQRTSKTQPLLVAQYPPGTKDVPDRVAMEAALTQESASQIADSPVRTEITKRLLQGESAVWIFVPSGDADQDATALKTLTEQVKLNESELELPVQDEIETEEDLLTASHLELRIKFSIVTLQRTDPNEQFLLSSLLHSEPDLLTLDEPMAFPVLGRGRVLYGLVGKGISSATISAVSQFIIGPCSCQVKNQNPGFDLLLTTDWDKQLFGEDSRRPTQAKPAAPVQLTIPAGKSDR